MRLIDADELVRKEIAFVGGPRSGGKTLAMIHSAIRHIVDNAPTVIAEPVRHGKWINEPPYKAVDGTYKKGQECSVCHSYFVSDGNTPYSNHPYCCECGAKMDGE